MRRTLNTLTFVYTHTPIPFIRWPFKNRSVTFPYFICIAKAFWDGKDLSLTPQTAALLMHELTHALQARHIGRLVWYFKYLTNSSFRSEQEIQAEAVEAATRAAIRNRTEPTLADVSHRLKSSTYWLRKKDTNQITERVLARAKAIYLPVLRIAQGRGLSPDLHALIN